MPTLTTTIQHSVGSVGHSNQSRKRSKRNPDRNRSETLTFADYIILYTENPKDSIRKLLELINEYSKVAGYTINTHNTAFFLTYIKRTMKLINKI